MVEPRDPSAHVQRSPKGGLVTLLLGGLVLASAFWPRTAIPGAFRGVDATLFQAALGAGLALVGASAAAWAATRPPPPRAPVAADVAFASKTRHDDEIIAIESAPERPASIAVPAPAPGAAAELESMGESEQLVLAIRDTRQRMSRAKVMLATGKLSNEAFTKLTKDLKAELAELESQQMQAELVRKG